MFRDVLAAVRTIEQWCLENNNDSLNALNDIKKPSMLLSLRNQIFWVI